MIKALLKFFLSNRQKFSDGSLIRQTHRDFFVYAEPDGRELEFEAYLTGGVGNLDRVVVARTIQNWLPPHEGEALNSVKIAEIIEKVCKYFERRGILYSVDKALEK